MADEQAKYELEKRKVEALEKIASHLDRVESTICPRCVGRCSKCDRNMPVVPELPDLWSPDLWREAFENFLKAKDASFTIRSESEVFNEEFAKAAKKRGFKKDRHGRWVTEEYLEANPHMRREDDS